MHFKNAYSFNSTFLPLGITKRGQSYPATFFHDMVGEWEQMFQEYHNDAPDGLLRTTGVVAGLVSKIAKKFPNFEFPKKIQQFALSRTCFRMNALVRKLAADRAETLKAKRKVLDFIYSSEPSKNGKKVSKVLFLQICLFENSSFYVLRCLQNPEII